jgi:heme/copper-type cytochrome/quinol oxidase subunit 4
VLRILAALHINHEGAQGVTLPPLITTIITIIIITIIIIIIIIGSSSRRALEARMIAR